MRYILLSIMASLIVLVMVSCGGGGGGGGGIGPIPTFDTSSTSTTSNQQNSKSLYVKVLRKKQNGDIEWLGSTGWLETAYVKFSANDNWNNDKLVYVDDGYWGTYTRFNYDTYTVEYVDVGIYRYYPDTHFEVRIGDTYGSSSEAWYARFTVDFYRPYGSSIYIVFKVGVTE
ncbi:MAG: hypothetical protein ABDH21_02735 [bacterium]